MLQDEVSGQVRSPIVGVPIVAKGVGRNRLFKRVKAEEPGQRVFMLIAPRTVVEEIEDVFVEQKDE